MYKVFVNDSLINLSDSHQSIEGAIVVNFDEISFKSFMQLVEGSTAKNICLLHKDVFWMWKEFKSWFKIQKAAGGVVFDKNGSILFIRRFDTWDLPKGKIEKGEGKRNAAIREVEEECGITALHIKKKLPKTYHIFERNGKVILKFTYWYQMQSGFNGHLVPQLEEGITEVVFKNPEETKLAMLDTYGNIKLLLEIVLFQK